MFDPIQIDARLTTLADKLGIERAELWNAIVRQARIEAWTDTAMALIGLLMIIVAWLLVVRVAKFGHANRSLVDDVWPGMSIIGIVLGCIALIVGTIIFLVNGYDAAQIFPNPVYYAYTHLVY